MSQSSQRRRDKHVTREIHRLFWRANFQHKTSLILGYTFRIPGFIALNTLIPLFSAYAIRGILQKDLSQVDRYAFFIVITGLVYAGLTYLGETSIIKNAMIGSRYIQRKVFANYLTKDYDFYTNSYFGALGAKANSLRDAFNLYGELVTLTVPRQITIVVSSLLIIAWQSLLLAVVTLIVLVALLGFTIAAGSYRVRFRRDVSVASSRLAGRIGDALTHGSTVKSFAMEAAEGERLNEPLTAWSRAQYKQWRTFVPTDMIRMTLAAIATAVLLLVSAHLYVDGKLPIAIVVLIQLYVVRLVASTSDIAQMIKGYEQLMSIAYDAVQTMLVQPTVVDPAKPQRLRRDKQHQLAFSGVDFRYPEAGKQQFAVRNFSLTVAPGEKVGIIGYSGSGKTTLTKLCLRFMDVNRGQITLDGIDIRDLAQADLRSVISYVPQEPLLFHRTIAENIAYAKPQATAKAVRQAAKLAYVNDFVKDLPHGYDTYVGERGVKLSGGQRQRVAIARALLKDAPILVLDEATSALDSASEKYIQEALWKLMAGRSAIVIAHRLSTIQRMDRIIVMDQGRIVQQGSHAELLQAKHGIYAQLWQHQSGGYLVTNPATT